MHADEKPTPPGGKENIAKDLALARKIAEGSLQSWHRFLSDYSGLIYKSLRRILVAEDEEDIKNAYVDILANIYTGDITSYDGKSKLSTWLFVYTRNYATDLLRKKHGRISRPGGYDRLSDVEREVLRLFFAEMLPMDIIIDIMNWSGYPIDAGTFIQSVQRIEDTISKQYLEALRLDHSSRTRGVASARLFNYLDQMRRNYLEQSTRSSPERYIAEKEKMGKSKILRQALEKLDQEEWDIINLRFFCGLTARETADKLGIKEKRKVYYITEKIIEKLRQFFK
jgi:RNA polymerase sigma factor (sigma-70 family)